MPRGTSSASQPRGFRFVFRPGVGYEGGKKREEGRPMGQKVERVLIDMFLGYFLRERERERELDND